MVYNFQGDNSPIISSIHGRATLNWLQIVGFWAAWFCWMLNGMASIIHVLVLGPALTELLPHSGIEPTLTNIGYVGCLSFGLFLVGWGLSVIWGPISDKFGRTRSFATAILIYAVSTGAAAFSIDVWTLAICRFLAGFGVGGEWAMAGTYIAEAWPKDQREIGAGYLQTGYYFGFFVAAALNYTVGASFGWRAMFICGLVPAVVSATLFMVKSPTRLERERHDLQAVPVKDHSWFLLLLKPPYLRRTITMSALFSISMIALWATAVYAPTAIVFLSDQTGMATPDAAKMVSCGIALFSIGAICGGIAEPWLAERVGRRSALAIYFFGMIISIMLAFGWAFYLPTRSALPAFLAMQFFLGLFVGNTVMFSLWLPEVFGARTRTIAFGFSMSTACFIGAGVNFGVAGAVATMHTLGTPILITAIAFAIGLLIIPFATESGHEVPPE